ncbi:MAG: hypothetical protein KDK07_20130 [Bauldia sp.]|nr:hypothetical protein [Bauldia sp.]
MSEPPSSTARIEIQVAKVSQLFDSLDPSPLLRRDLAERAEDYIVGSARELPTKQAIEIVVHLPDEEAASLAAGQLAAAFRNYFEDRAEHAALELKNLLRVGRLSLVIGMAVLALALVVGTILSKLMEGMFGQYWIEGLVILGWVALWRPMEIFLYEWWPILRERNLYRRLAAAGVAVKPIGDRG